MLNKTTLGSLTRAHVSLQSMLILLWVFTMISVPIINWTFGWDVVIAAILVGVLVQTSVVIVILWKFWGISQTIRIATLVMVLGFAAEMIGSRTGFPFGAYSYTEALQPQLFHVPIVIPLAWLMMLPPAWGIAYVISKELVPRWQGPAFILISALSMTAWDLFLDPQMVAWGLWFWDDPGGFFGIPWSNYIGWLLVSALITLILRPKDLPLEPLILIYTITWLLQTIGQGFFWNMPGPAIVGGIIMGGLTIIGWISYRKNLE